MGVKCLAQEHNTVPRPDRSFSLFAGFLLKNTYKSRGGHFEN